MKKYEQLVEMTVDVLEPDISFANGGYGDNVHHLLLEQFPQLLSQMTIHLVLPMLTGIVSSVLGNLIFSRGGNRVHLGVPEGSRHVVGEQKFVDENVITTDEVINSLNENEFNDDVLSSATVDDTKVEEAEQALSQFLNSNGWPAKIAERDSKEIIAKIIEILRQYAKK